MENEENKSTPLLEDKDKDKDNDTDKDTDKDKEKKEKKSLSLLKESDRGKNKNLFSVFKVCIDTFHKCLYTMRIVCTVHNNGRNGVKYLKPTLPERIFQPVFNVIIGYSQYTF